MRMHNRRFTRLTNAFSKKFENHAHMVAIYAVWYNWLRIHKTLRVTPAMAAGLSKTLMTWEKFLDHGHGGSEVGSPRPLQEKWGAWVMGLNFRPNPGTILVCNYETGFIEPEMIKTRLVVVITPRLRRQDGLCTVVPLSTTPPEPPEKYHCQVTLERPLPTPWGGVKRWAKCDMFATVSFGRLSPIGIGKRGKTTRLRKYIYPTLSNNDLITARKCVLHALDFSHLTNDLK